MQGTRGSSNSSVIISKVMLPGDANPAGIVHGGNYFDGDWRKNRRSYGRDCYTPCLGISDLRRPG